jgi:hypothetical protein
LGYLGVDRRIILKLVSNEWKELDSAGREWFSVSGFYECGHETSGSVHLFLKIFKITLIISDCTLLNSRLV